MIPASAADTAAMPTVPMSHFRCLSFAAIYGLRSSVPGMTQASVCPTQYPSISMRSIRFMMDRITSPCQKAGQEAPRAVDRVDANEHIGHICRNTQAPEAHAPPPDGFPGRHAKLYDAVLNLLIIQMHHPDRAVPNADGADDHQQRAKTKSFYHEFHHKHSPFTFVVLLYYAIIYRDCPA